MKLEQTLTINEWITNCLEGSEEFIAFKEFRVDTDASLSANWIIKCLMDPQREGSEEILQTIIDKRKELGI